MIALRTLHRLAMVSATLLLAACDYDCGTVSSTVASGALRDGTSAVVATVYVELRKGVGPSLLRLSVGVAGSAGSGGAPLRGYVTRARLVTQDGQLIAEIPTSTAAVSPDGVVALIMDLGSEEEYDRVRSALLTTHAKVVVDTNLPGLEQIETILLNAAEVAGNVRRCPYT